MNYIALQVPRCFCDDAQYSGYCPGTLRAHLTDVCRVVRWLTDLGCWPDQAISSLAIVIGSRAKRISLAPSSLSRC